MDLIEDQRHVLDQIVDYIREAQIDVCVIAGDIFDRSNPPQAALKLVNDYLYKINIELGVPVLAISGNHDSKPRLEYGSYWFEKSRYHMRTQIEDILAPVVIGNTHFYMVPYLDVLEAKVYFEDDTIVTHHNVYERVTAEIYDVMDTEAYNVFIGHMFMAEGKASESERPLSIGLSEEVSASLFERFDLVLLGHLHHPFAITRESIFYSGSLLKYSFSEVSQPKGFRVIQTDAGAECRFIPLKQRHDLVQYHGSFDDVINERVGFEDSRAYFKFELTDMQSISDPMARLKLLYPNTLELRPVFGEREKSESAIDIKAADDREIFQSFISQVYGGEMTDYQKEIFHQYFTGDTDETD